MKINWNIIDVAKLKENDVQEINRAYNILKPFFLWYLKNNEEHFHDVFIKMQTRLYSYDQNKPFHSWLFKLLKNYKTDCYKKNEKLKLISIDSYDESISEFVSYQNDFRVYKNDLIEQEEIEYFIEHKSKRFELLSELKQEELSFVCDYAKDMINKTPTNRKRYERICKRLQKLDR